MARPRRVAALVAAAVALAAVLALAVRLQRDVRRALDGPAADARPMQLVALPPPAHELPLWTGPEVEAVAFPGGDLVTAGAGGVRDLRRGDLSAGLPTRRAVAAALWTGDLVVALDAGGIAVRRGGAWSEMRSGWGVLHARCLAGAPGGELLVGAREGLFRARAGSGVLERLASHPVRALASGPGFVLAGGEQGLRRVSPGRTAAIDTADPWIEWVELDGDFVWAVTAAGLGRGPREGPLAAVRGAESVSSAVLHEGRVYAATDPPAAAVRVYSADGSVREEALPAPVRRVMGTHGLLFADARDGLHRRDTDGWRLAVGRRGSLPPGSAHVTALARFRDRLVAGFFDGGLATATAAAEPRGPGLEWREVPGTAAWGVNALLPAGGELWVASLRGAARDDGRRLVPVEGPGAAFALAATRGGVAVGYGQGLRVADASVLSAFHGLPGNQVTALAEADVLYVGTPSGLGAVSGRRVLWRTTAGEGKLPHPWVTALIPEGEGLLVGTWGGGLARRSPASRPRAGERTDTGRYEPFVETEGLAVSAGAIAISGGRAFVGTDAHGLWRQSPDLGRFERVDLPLPSPRVSALLAEPGALWVGTDQGLVRLPLESTDE